VSEVEKLKQANAKMQVALDVGIQHIKDLTATALQVAGEVKIEAQHIKQNNLVETKQLQIALDQAIKHIKQTHSKR
jgi:hypothetical protein